MKTKVIATIMTMLFLASITIFVIPMKADPAVLHVDDDGAQWPGAYATISAALAVASSGDTIIVHDGTYDGFEADIYQITVIAAYGETPVISGTMATGSPWGGQVVGVLVTADEVTIQGFKITGQYSTGIWVVDGADDVQIRENAVDQTGFDPAALTGVTWDGSAIQSHGDGTVIRNNRVKFGYSSRPHNGINVFWNSYTIKKNTVTIFEAGKYQVGINVRGTATVEKNRVVGPDKSVGTWTKVFGIWLAWPVGSSTVQDNQVSKTDYAVWLSGPGTAGSVIKSNTLVNNGIGIILEYGATATIEDNRIKNSWWADYWP